MFDWVVNLYEAGTSDGAIAGWKARRGLAAKAKENWLDKQGSHKGLVKHVRTVKEHFAKLKKTQEPFTVHFHKRSTGSLRKMRAFFGIGKPLVGTGMAYDPKKHNLAIVYDLGKANYRAIPLEGVRMIKYSDGSVKKFG